ncbi:MAG: endolytic transglycosylase MltG [Acidimicrobiales bacterium]|nr:endolytic transglycosylase MltG [Acidimicrobiales bacterium]
MSDSHDPYGSDTDADDEYERYDEPYDDEIVYDDDDGEYVYIPREMGIVRKGMVVFAVFAVVVVGLVGVAGWWAVSQVRGTGQTGDEVTLSVPTGATLTQVSSLLEEAGVIENGTIFRYYGKWKGLESVKAGQYDDLYQGMALDDVIVRLQADPLPEQFIDVNFPEGMTFAAMHSKILNSFPQMTDAELVNAEAAAVAGATKYHTPQQPLEGFLFPATYRVQESAIADEGALLGQMMTKFDQVADEVGLADAPTKLSGVAGSREVTPYEALIVASMIEKEAKVDEDRAKIARVIYNRLERNMRMEIDATLFYCPELRDKQELTRSDLQIDCPYNTRQRSGLPPTPIANPGKASLEAALNPAEGEWLYYVLSDAEGRHFFTDDYDEFLDAQAQAQQDGLL